MRDFVCKCCGGSGRELPLQECDLADLDLGIRMYVEVLRGAGIETYESCEGGDSHSFPCPTIRFHGGREEGYRATAVALLHCLPIAELSRIWFVVDGELTGPDWQITFATQRAEGERG